MTFSVGSGSSSFAFAGFEIWDAALIEELLNLSADPSLMDNRGFTAFHLLLRYIFRSGWNKDFAGVIRRISPQSTTLRLNGHEIKIGSHKAESLMYHISWMIIHSAISYYRGKVSAIESSTICEILSKLPDFFVPAYRKAQNYCSAILSKNEANSTNPYGLRLFYRLRNGHYILNPALEIPYNGKWLFWDELAMMDYWNLPLEYLPYDAVRQLIEDVRMHCKNPDIRRSFLSVYFLKVGFCRYLPLIQDYPPVCGADLAAALKRIQSRMAELPPLPLKREDLNSQNGGKTFYSRPWIYPGETPEEVTLRNYFRHHPESSPLLQKEYQLLLEQQRAEIKKDPSQMQMPQDENEKRAREVAAENERLNRMEEIYRKHMREIEIMDRERERFRKEAGEDLYKEVYRKDFNLNVQKEFLKKTTPDLFSIDDDEE